MKGIFKSELEELINGELVHEREVAYILENKRIKMNLVGKFIKFTDQEKNYSRYVEIAPF